MTATRDPGSTSEPGWGSGSRRCCDRRDGAGARSLASATVVAPSLDPIALYAAAVEADSRRRCGSVRPRARRSSGIGRAWAVEAAGAGRFHDAEAAWRELLAGARVDRPADATPAPVRCCWAGWGSPAVSPPPTTRGRRSARARSSCPISCSR